MFYVWVCHNCIQPVIVWIIFPNISPPAVNAIISAPIHMFIEDPGVKIWDVDIDSTFFPLLSLNHFKI